MKRLLWAFIVVVASISLSGCGTMQVFGTKITPTFTDIPAPTKITPISTDKPAPTKIEPTATSSEPAKPTVDPEFRNPDNVKTDVFENGAWFLKNAKGDPTAKWNTEIAGPNKWDTRRLEANITYQQVIIGNKVDQSILEPFLGSLPPDDPATHFKDASGNLVDYGIGPETTVSTVGTDGQISIPTTELFARFRGAAVIPSPRGAKYNEVAQIFEVLRGETSIIIVSVVQEADFSFIGSPHDMYVQNRPYNTNSRLHVGKFSGAEGVETANKYLRNMVMVGIFHNHAQLVSPQSPDYPDYVKSDEFTDSLLKYISGKSDVVPIAPFDQQAGIFALIIFPDSQLYVTPIGTPTATP